MKTINLLPKEEKIKDVKSIMLSVVLVILVIILIAAGGFSFVLYNVSSILTPELENYERVNMQLNNYINKLEVYNKFREKVEKKGEVVEYLKKEELLWSDLLYDFSSKIPENSYIRYIEGNERFYYFIEELEKGEAQDIGKILFFTISGSALDYTDITRLMVQIRNMEKIGDVILNNVSKDYVTENNIEVLSFNISAYLDTGPYIEKYGVKKKTGTEEDEDSIDRELEMLEE